MKFAKTFTAISMLILTGCATTMTPQQHNLFSQDYALLNMCSERGLINQNLAANGLALYHDRLRIYKADTDLLDSQINQYYQQGNSINSSVCNQYAVRLQSELIQKQQDTQSNADLNRALGDFSNSMQKSTEGWQRIIESNNARGY